MALLTMGIAAEVQPAGELSDIPTGYYKFKIVKAEDVKKEVTNKETGQKEDRLILRLGLTIEDAENPKLVGTKVPTWVSEFWYPTKADDRSNGSLLTILMAATGKDEAALRKVWAQIDPARDLSPKDGKFRSMFGSYKNKGRKIPAKDDKPEGHVDVMYPISQAEFLEGRKNSAANTAAAGGGGTVTTDPFPGGGDNGAGASSGAASDLFS